MEDLLVTSTYYKVKTIKKKKHKYACGKLER